MDQHTPALSAALLYSDSKLLSESEYFLFAKLGLAHIFSGSGFHMFSCWAFSAACGEFLCQGLHFFLRKSSLSKNWSASRRRWHAGFTLVLILVLCTSCSWKKAMVRSFSFVALFLGAKILEVRAAKGWLLAWSLTLCILWGRGGLLSLLLTFVGVLSFQAAYSMIDKKKVSRPQVLLPLVPYFCLLPITLYFFSSFSPLAPIHNLLLCPLLSIGILMPGFVSILETNIFSTHYFEQISNYNAEHLFTLIYSYEGHCNIFYWVHWPSFLLVFALLLPTIFLWEKVKFLSLLYALLIFWAFSLYPQHFHGTEIFDVHQGDSIFTQAEKSVLIDAGPATRSNYPSRSSQALEKLAIDSIDDILLTHPDADHYGGLQSIFLRHEIKGALWIHPESLQYPKVEKVLALAEAAKVPIHFFPAERFSLGELSCHWQRFTKNVNALSPLCRLRLGSGKILLLTGDMDASSEIYYHHHFPTFLASDYLKLAHHGSKNSSSEEFLRAVGAREVFISVGKKNRYHHPSQETMERLKELNIKARLTSEEGSIFLE